jgi:hypothetical protein
MRSNVFRSVIYTHEEAIRVLTMEQTRESYQDRIRRIAEDLTQARHLLEMDYYAERLRQIADEIEGQLKAVKALNSE